MKSTWEEKQVNKVEQILKMKIIPVNLIAVRNSLMKYMCGLYRIGINNTASSRQEN